MLKRYLKNLTKVFYLQSKNLNGNVGNEKLKKAKHILLLTRFIQVFLFLSVFSSVVPYKVPILYPLKTPQNGDIVLQHTGSIKISRNIGTQWLNKIDWFDFSCKSPNEKVVTLLLQRLKTKNVTYYQFSN